MGKSASLNVPRAIGAALLWVNLTRSSTFERSLALLATSLPIAQAFRSSIKVQAATIAPVLFVAKQADCQRIVIILV